MKVFIQDIGEITDSREMLESTPHPVTSVFIYIVAALISIALVWSYFGEIDESVKARGIVRPNQLVGTVRNKVTGRVTDVNIKEGDHVKKGELLYSIDYSLLDTQKDVLENEYEKAVKELKNLEKLRLSILDGKNYFNRELESEKEYYNKFVKYKSDAELQAVETKINKSALSEVNDALAGLTALKESIIENRSMFSENDGVYYNQFIDYSLNLKKLEDAAEQKRELYESSLELAEAGAISKNELESLKMQLDSVEIDIQKYKNEFLLSTNKSIDDYKEKSRQLQISLQSSSLEPGTVPGVSGNVNNLVDESGKAVMEKFRIDAIVQVESDIRGQQANIEKLKLELESVKSGISDCGVVSPIDGYISLHGEINTGDLLQSGTEIAAIIPEDDSEFRVQLFVQNKDIANIEVGQEIKYYFTALPYKEYGILSGKVTGIGTDARVDQAKGISYYIAEASLENKPLYGRKGTMAEVKVGMECEAQVIIKTKKVLYYLLEKINLRD